MNPLNAQEGKKANLPLTNNQDNRILQANAGRPRSNNTNNTILTTPHNPAPLYCRELTFPAIATDDYTQEVIKMIKHMSLESLKRATNLLASKGKSEFSIQVQLNDPIEKHAFASAERNYLIYKFKLQRLCYEQGQGNMALPKYCNKESIPNGILCWQTLTVIFRKYFEYEEDRNVFLEFNSKETANDIIIQDTDLFIRDAIKSLEKIKQDCYFSILGIMMDPSLHLETKIHKIMDYTGDKTTFTASDFSKISEDPSGSSYLLKDALDGEIRNMACYVAKLQVLLDCLNKIKNLPKTLHNLKILHRTLFQCHACFKEDFASMKKYQQHRPTSRFCKDYFMIEGYLKDLVDKFAKPINNAIKEISASLLDEVKPSSQKKSKNKNRRKKIVHLTTELKTFEENKNLKKPEDGKALVTTKLNAEQITNATTIANNSINQTNNTETIPNSIILDEISDEDSLETVELETNILMEVLRQIFDKDRAAKLKLKEEKLKKPKILTEKKEETANSEIKIQSPDPLLNTKHQETLEALFPLFQKKPENLKILGSDVESLIKELGGNSVGNQGSKFQIYWHGSNKKAGEYEVAHGVDRKGYLTSDYASRVADAIYVGIKHNCIAKNRFPQILLSLIENHVIANNG